MFFYYVLHLSEDFHLYHHFILFSISLHLNHVGRGDIYMFIVTNRSVHEKKINLKYKINCAFAKQHHQRENVLKE